MKIESSRAMQNKYGVGGEEVGGGGVVGVRR